MDKIKILTVSAFTLFIMANVTRADDGKPSQLVARNALGQVVTYEQQVEAKITSAQTFYNTTRADLLEDIRSASGRRQRTLIKRAASTAADGAVRSTGTTAEDFRSFGEEIARSVTERRDQEEQRLRVIRNDYLKSLESLDLDKASLQAVRKGLEQLQADLSTIERMKRMLDAAAKIKAGYDTAIAGKN
jgi:hypothetical protein